MSKPISIDDTAVVSADSPPVREALEGFKKSRRHLHAVVAAQGPNTSVARLHPSKIAAIPGWLEVTENFDSMLARTDAGLESGDVDELKTLGGEFTQGSFGIMTVVEHHGLRVAPGNHDVDRKTYDLDLNISLPGLDEYELTALRRLLTHNLQSLVAAARHENCEERVTQLLKAIAPPDPMTDVQLKVASATAELRREFLEEEAVLTSTEIHANAGFPGGNASQTVHRWRTQGKIFAIKHGGRDLYPAFQFGRDGRPLPIMAELLTILRADPERTDWDNALWFAGDSGWLDGRTPIECLQANPEAVKRAAEQELLLDEQ